MNCKADKLEIDSIFLIFRNVLQEAATDGVLKMCS